MDEFSGTRRTWTTVAAACAVAGGASWLIKQVPIAASSSGDGPPENVVIGVFYLLGLALMVVGATGLAARLLGGVGPAVWIPAALLSGPVLFFGVQAGADTVVDGLAAAEAHWWWAGEGGIVLTAVVFLAYGLVLLRSRTARRTAAAVASS
jgi:hypothetical protein